MSRQRAPSPVTKAQVDAYRFGLRRMDAALTSKDPVPLHEELRGQRRAVAVGIVLAMLATAGAVIWARLDPGPDWRGSALVVGRQSGAMYAVGTNPDRLVPVADIAAGRLVRAALGSPAPTAEPAAVDDERLANAPRAAPAAVPGVPWVRPGAGSAAPPRWAACSTQPVGTSSTSSGDEPGTTLVVGAEPPPTALTATEAVLVRARPGAPLFLLANGERQRVNPGGRAAAAYRLGGHVPWTVGDAVLAALPEGRALSVPSDPEALPRLVEPGAARTVCVHWSAVAGEPAIQASVPSVLPVPPRTGVTRLAQGDGPGPALDAVSVRAGSTPELRAAAALWLLSETGTAYAVADVPTAEALGVGDAAPAPPQMLALLPTGPPLDLGNARRLLGGG